MSIATTTKVQLIIEVSNVGSWGGECSMAQITKQATEQATGKLLKLLAGDESSKYTKGDIKLVKAIKVIQTQVDVDFN
jgi:hypothetical protein